MLGDAELTPNGIQYDGTEGELCDLCDDPHQRTNLWDDPAHAAARADLVADLHDTLRTVGGRTRRKREFDATVARATPPAVASGPSL